MIHQYRTWSRACVILFGAPDGLRRVPASGGVLMLLTKSDAARQESGHGYLQFLPDGKRFLYFVQSGDSNTQGIYAGPLDRPQDRVQILRTSAKALYAPPVAGHPGYLVWLRAADSSYLSSWTSLKCQDCPQP